MVIIEQVRGRRHVKICVKNKREVRTVKSTGRGQPMGPKKYKPTAMHNKPNIMIGCRPNESDVMPAKGACVWYSADVMMWGRNVGVQREMAVDTN